MIMKQNFWQLASVQIGAAICLPVILVGQTLSQTYGLTSSIIAILLGNLVLLLLGLVMAKISFEKKTTTIENAREYFGEKGIAFFGITISLALLGWYAIQLNMMTLSVVELLSIQTSVHPYAPIIINIVLGITATLVLLRGIRSINFLANLSVPLLIASLLYAIATLKHDDQIPQQYLTFSGISLVIATAITCVMDLPTYFRHAKTHKDAIWGIVIIFGVALPLVEISGVYLALGNTGTILDVLKRDNNVVWNLWIAIFLILAGWTTNNLNHYSAVVCLAPILKKLKESTKTLLIGGIGTLLSCFDLLKHLEAVLASMGIVIASMGSVIIMRYLLVQIKKLKVTPKDYPWHFLAWALGSAAGFLSMTGYFSITSISLLDATITAALGTLLILTRRTSYEEVYIR